MKKSQLIFIGAILIGISAVLSACESLYEGKEFTDILWIKKFTSPIFSSTALDASQNLIVGTRAHGLFALNLEGEEVWHFAPKDDLMFESSPAIAPDGTIYVGSSIKRSLYALNPDGTEKWNFKTAGEVFASPAIAKDGTVYIASYDFKLYAVNPDGEMKWFINTNGYNVSSPVIGADGTIYLGSLDGFLYAINSDGTEKWKFRSQGEIFASPAINKDNSVVYFGSEAGDFYAIATDTARLLWYEEKEGAIFSSVILTKEGNILLARKNFHLNLLNPDGETIWNIRLAGENYASPAIGNDGTIYVCSTRNDNDRGYFSIVSPDGKIIWQKEFDRDLRSSPIIGPNGHVYFGSNIGWYYAIRGKSTGPATHHWSKFRGNNMNSGSAQ